MTGAQQTVENFLLATDPAAKLAVLSVIDHLWVGIRSEVKEYVLENINGWERDQPQFWNAKMIERATFDMMTAAMQRRQKAAGDGQRKAKMASVFELVFDPEDDD